MVRKRRYTERMSRRLSDKRIREIEAAPIIYDDDSPQLSEEELQKFRPAREMHPEWFDVVPKKKRISILIDVDILVLETLKSEGRGYQTRINSILREAVFGKEM